MSSSSGKKGQKLGEINEKFFIKKLEGWRHSILGKKIIKYLIPDVKLKEVRSVKAFKITSRKGKLGSPKTDVGVDIKRINDNFHFNLSLKSTQLNGTLAHICRHKVLAYEKRLNLSKIAGDALRKIVGEEGYSPEDLLNSGKLSKIEYTRLTPKRRGHKKGDPFYSFCFIDLEEKEKKALLSELETRKIELLKFAFLGQDGSDQVDSIFITFWDPQAMINTSISNLRAIFGLSRSGCITYFSSERIKPSSTGSSLSLGELILKKTRTHGSNPTDLQVQWSYKYKNLIRSNYVTKVYLSS